jgi:hypothetical protein
MYSVAIFADAVKFSSIMPEMFDNIPILMLLFLILSLGKYATFKISSLEHILRPQEQQASGSVEPPASVECTEDFGQPMFQILPAEEIMTHEYGTRPVDTWLPILQADNQFIEDIMG